MSRDSPDPPHAPPTEPAPPPAGTQPAQVPAPPEPDALARSLAVYGRLSARHQSHVTIMWQAPALGLTAQAFLLAISLSSSAANTARALASGLGAIAVLMSMQLMAKHRVISKRDDEALQRLENEMGVSSPWAGLPVSGSLWGSRLSSYLTWQVGLSLFAAVNVGVLVSVLVGVV